MDYQAECLKRDPLLWADDDGENCIAIRRQILVRCTCAHGITNQHMTQCSTAQAIAVSGREALAWKIAYDQLTRSAQQSKPETTGLETAARLLEEEAKDYAAHAGGRNREDEEAEVIAYHLRRMARKIRELSAQKQGR